MSVYTVSQFCIQALKQWGPVLVFGMTNHVLSHKDKIVDKGDSPHKKMDRVSGLFALSYYAWMLAAAWSSWSSQTQWSLTASLMLGAVLLHVATEKKFWQTMSDILPIALTLGALYTFNIFTNMSILITLAIFGMIYMVGKEAQANFQMGTYFMSRLKSLRDLCDSLSKTIEQLRSNMDYLATASPMLSTLMIAAVELTLFANGISSFSTYSIYCLPIMVTMAALTQIPNSISNSLFGKCINAGLQATYLFSLAGLGLRINHWMGLPLLLPIMLFSPKPIRALVLPTGDNIAKHDFHRYHNDTGLTNSSHP